MWCVLKEMASETPGERRISRFCFSWRPSSKAASNLNNYCSKILRFSLMANPNKLNLKATMPYYRFSIDIQSLQSSSARFLFHIANCVAFEFWPTFFLSKNWLHLSCVSVIAVHVYRSSDLEHLPWTLINAVRLFVFILNAPFSAMQVTSVFCPKVAFYVSFKIYQSSSERVLGFHSPGFWRWTGDFWRRISYNATGYRHWMPCSPSSSSNRTQDQSTYFILFCSPVSQQ